MRKVITVSVTVLLFSALLALAQGPSAGNPGQGHGPNAGPNNSQGKDDHDDKGPVQVGYGVVTPVSATTSGLVVFESFGMRGNSGNSPASQAGVLPPDLTTNAILFVDSNGRLSKNLGVAIVNPNASNVNVKMTLRKDNGAELATTTINVPARQQVS